jgi:hypothetical protein
LKSEKSRENLIIYSAGIRMSDHWIFLLLLGQISRYCLKNDAYVRRFSSKLDDFSNKGMRGYIR